MGEKLGQLRSDRAPWLRRHRILALLAFNACVFLAVGLVFEVVLRSASPEWLEHRMAFLAAGGRVDEFGTDRSWKILRDSGRFLSFEPHSEFDVVHAEYRNVAIIDGLGGRKLNPESDSDRLLPCLGDSFTFGVGVENGQTFVDHLQECMAAESGPRLVNLGSPDSALPQQRFVVEKRHEALANPPIYLEFFFLGNDFHDILKIASVEEEARLPQTESEDEAAWIDLSAAMNAYLNKSWFRHSYAIQFLRRAVLQISRDARRFPVFHLMEKANTSLHRQVREALRSELEKWGELAREEGFTVVVILVPDRNQIVAVRRERQARYYGLQPSQLDPYLLNRILTDALEEQGVRYVDPTRELMAMHDTETLYYVNDNHFTAEGHRRFARVICDELNAILSEMRYSISKADRSTP